jgi:hypothetical protein
MFYQTTGYISKYHFGLCHWSDHINYLYFGIWLYFHLQLKIMKKKTCYVRPIGRATLKPLLPVQLQTEIEQISERLQ